MNGQVATNTSVHLTSQKGTKPAHLTTKAVSSTSNQSGTLALRGDYTASEEGKSELNLSNSLT